MKRIKAIKFGLLSPSLIRKMSVAQIVTFDTYDEDGFPVRSGLMDPRLGTIEPGQKCETCKNYVGVCPGHFGHIELARPVIHVSFAHIIYQLLRSTCKNCGRIKIPEKMLAKLREQNRKYKEKRGISDPLIVSQVTSKAERVRMCPHCGQLQPKIIWDKPVTFIEERTDPDTGLVERVKLDPIEVRSRLELIPSQDVELLGLDPENARPEWMVLTVLPVPPICVRPSITLESGVKSEDDLTHKLTDILRINEREKEQIESGAPKHLIDSMWGLLQYHVMTYFDNELPNIPPAKHRSRRRLRTLAQRLKGKEGRFRSNLSGKRVDFSARTVISPDPNLSINEVGVPLEVAKILTVPVRVTEFNIEHLKQLVIRGPENYPGANYIIREDGRRIDLRYPKDRSLIAETLKPGMIVERHLQNGDIVLFNRQPSLHRMSIMAHEVRVLPYRTFRLHLFVCPPYNADFDGDEMNLHVPQSEEAIIEARLLMKVQEQTLTPRYGAPIIGAICDYVTAAYILTSKFTLIDKRTLFELLASMDYDGPIPPPVIKKPKAYWTGKQIFSLLLPKSLNYSLKASVCSVCSECKRSDCPNDSFVIVRKGKLLAGVIDKKSIGAGVPESLLHRIVKDYGVEEGRKFLDKLSRLLIRTLDQYGFTTGIDDEDLPEEAIRQIRAIVNKAEERVAELIRIYEADELEAMPGQTLEETLEMRIMEVLTETRERAGQVASSYLGKDNAAVIMASTGAKGKDLNIQMMTAFLGQQSIRGKRITRGYRDRVLAHFKVGDKGARAHGFVAGNYKRGLNPIEFFFHSMGGREGLVDTAVRTAQSGYMQRRLIYALQDVEVAYDGTVRDEASSVIQFKYGEDGVDPANSDHGKAINIDKILEMVGVMGE